MVFGKKILKKDFRSLQSEAKLMKPASMNKLLGKRDLEANTLDESTLKNTGPIQPPKRKNKRLKRSSSLLTRLDKFSVKEDYGAPKLANLQEIKETKNFDSGFQRQRKYQVEIGLSDLNERSTRENLNDNLAYNLGTFNIAEFLWFAKTQFFAFFGLIFLEEI